MIDVLHIVAILLCIVLVIALEDIHRVREWHHGYYGAALFGLQLELGWPVWTLWAAIALLLDDDVQHGLQALGLVDRMHDFTPIHKIGALLVRLFQQRGKMKAWMMRQGMWLPIAIGVLMAAAAIFCAVRFGV